MAAKKRKHHGASESGAASDVTIRGAGRRFRTVNRGFLVAGLLMAAVALFIAPVSLRNFCILVNLGAYVQDSFDVEFLQEGSKVSSRSLVGVVVSSGERLVTKRIDLINKDQRKQLAGKGRFPGHREPVWYLPPTGFLAGMDRILDFRLLSPNELKMARTIGVGLMLLNIAFGLGGALLVRRELRRALKELRSRKPL